MMMGAELLRESNGFKETNQETKKELERGRGEGGKAASETPQS